MNRFAKALFMVFLGTLCMAQEAPPTKNRCVSGMKSISEGNLRKSSSMDAFVPSSAYVTFAFPISADETLVAYEMGNWARHWANSKKHREAGDLTDPDTTIVIVRNRKPLFQFALRNAKFFSEDREWGKAVEIVKIAQLCGEQEGDFTYFVLQTGNAGGFMMAIRKLDENFSILPIGDAGLGRLVLSNSSPSTAEIWTEDGGECTACLKHFLVKKYEFNGTKFALRSSHRTKKRYGSFQDDPLLMRP